MQNKMEEAKEKRVLTDAEKARIEKNRLKAQALRESRVAV